MKLELEKLVKQYGIKDSKPDEKFIKVVQKSAATTGMTVAEYRDKILFPHGKEQIKARFQKFLALHPDAEGRPEQILGSKTSVIRNHCLWKSNLCN